MGARIGAGRGHGEQKVNAGDAIAAIAVYRIDNSFMLTGRWGLGAILRAPEEIMTTRAMFEGHLEDAFGANPDAHVDAPAGNLPSARPPHLDLSLHSDLDSIEQEWRTFEASADCTVFQTFDWLSTWFRNIGVHQGAKPAVVIGRHGGESLFLLPFASKRMASFARSHGLDRT